MIVNHFYGILLSVSLSFSLSTHYAFIFTSHYLIAASRPVAPIWFIANEIDNSR